MDYTEGLSPYVLRGLADYRDLHCPTGGFLKAMISGQYELARRQADPQNREQFVHIMALVAELPPESRGSPAAYAAWVKQFKGWED
jgi:hypothetical protein